jgi:heptosyltransferase-2
MKILVYLPRSLGASILALPCLRSLQENFPAACISILPPEKYAQLFFTITPDYAVVNLPEFKEIAGLQKASSRLKKMNFELGLLLDESFASALLFYLARIPQRWGYDREGRGFMLSKRIGLKAADPQLHLKYHYLNILERLGLKVEDRPYHLNLPENCLRAGQTRLRQAGLDPESPIVLIKPGSSFGPARVWPLSYQVELVNKLGNNSYQVVLLGSEASQDTSRKIMTQIDGRAADLSGNLSLDEAAGILALARVYLGNDSGLTLLANFLGIPVVGLYGPTDPHLCGPVQAPAVALKKSVPCSPCSYRSCPYDHRCLKNISVDEVLEAISAFLAT